MQRMFTQYEDDDCLEIKLDGILFFLANEEIGNENLKPDFGFRIKDICEWFNIDINDGDDRVIQAKLLTDGFIKAPVASQPNMIRITDKGLDFTNEKGYAGLSIEQDERNYKEFLEQRVQFSTIRTNKWVIMSVIISIVALIVAVIK